MKVKGVGQDKIYIKFNKLVTIKADRQYLIVADVNNNTGELYELLANGKIIEINNH